MTSSLTYIIVFIPYYRGDENPVNQESIYDNCECRTRALLNDREAPRNEKEMMEQMLEVCEMSTNMLSSYGSPYYEGFNSLLECLRYEYRDFLGFILKQYDHAEFLKQYHSEIDLPPDPGCEVNWMWFLSSFENVKYAQVSI